MGQRSTCNNRLKAVALGLALALGALTIRHGYETFSFGHPSCDNCRPDFPSLYSGAKLMWKNRAALYDLDQQLKIQKTIDPRIADSVLAFAYPPTTALVLMPLGWLSFSNAYLLMTVVNVLVLMLALRVLAKNLALNGEQFQWLLLTTFCSFGVHSAILQGQTSILLILPVSLFIRSVLQGSQTAAGLCIGALFFKPQLLPVPFLVLTAQRRGRALALGISLLAVSAILSVSLVGWDGINDYFRLAQRFGASESDLGTNPQDMHNLRALVYYALPATLVTPVWIGGEILLAIGALFLNAKAGVDEKGIAAQWVGNMLVIILLSPHLHAHDLALLIPANAFVLKLCRGSLPVTVSCSLVALGIFPLLPWLLATPLPPVLPLVFLIAFVGCVWFVRSLSR